MLFKRLCIILLIAALMLSAAAFFYIYAKRDRFIGMIKQGLENSFSEAAGADIRIGRIDANIFDNIILHNLSLESENYNIRFDKARLEYSLLDIVFFEKPHLDRHRDTSFELSGGILKFKGCPVECRHINGRISLTPDKIILKALDFDILGIIEVYCEGELINSREKTNLDLLFKLRPFFDKGGSLFEGLTLRTKGPADNLTIYANLEKKDSGGILLDGYLLSAEKTINLGTRLKFSGLKDTDSYSISMDTEVDPENMSFDVVLIPPYGKIAIHGDYSRWPELKIDVDTQHIKLGGFDFLNSAHILSRTAFKDGDFSHLTLDIETESTVFNYQPFDELEAAFWIDRDILRVIYIKIGDTILVSGFLNFTDPVEIFIKTALSDFDITRALAFTESLDAAAIYCRMSGEVFIEGPADRLATRAKLEAGEGCLGTVDYTHMILNLKGIGPLLRVYESRLIRNDSFLTLDGTLDLRRLGSNRFMDDITVSTDEKTIVWEGWDISRIDDDGELTLKKGVDGGLKVGFKTHVAEDETTYQIIRPQDELKLEYGTPDAEGSLQIKAKENEDFFGVMKRYKF